MTTARSSLHALTQQADRIAKALKAAERGEIVAPDPGNKIASARSRTSITFAVVMDDKTVKIEMPWTTIRDSSEHAISQFIVQHMRADEC